jgi:hypothetical protein
MRRRKICGPDASSRKQRKASRGVQGVAMNAPARWHGCSAKSVQDACRVSYHAAPRMQNAPIRLPPKGATSSGRSPGRSVDS